MSYCTFGSYNWVENGSPIQLEKPCLCRSNTWVKVVCCFSNAFFRVITVMDHHRKNQLDRRSQRKKKLIQKQPFKLAFLTKPKSGTANRKKMKMFLLAIAVPVLGLIKKASWNGCFWISFLLWERRWSSFFLRWSAVEIISRKILIKICCFSYCSFFPRYHNHGSP